jgi:hypothetical protein
MILAPFSPTRNAVLLVFAPTLPGIIDKSSSSQHSHTRKSADVYIPQTFRPSTPYTFRSLSRTPPLSRVFIAQVPQLLLLVRVRGLFFGTRKLPMPCRVYILSNPLLDCGVVFPAVFDVLDSSSAGAIEFVVLCRFLAVE